MENTKNYAFFQNTKCEYFPCHSNFIGDMEEFNCLFCFCPLYGMNECGGYYELSSTGVKDCSDCVYPHIKQNYDRIVKRIRVVS